MAPRNGQGLGSKALWALIRRQYGVVSHSQLVAFGYGLEAIRHRIRIGRLHRLHRGVYAVGRREVTREGRWMAATLACGEGAALSHMSAAALWKIRREPRSRIEVSVSGTRHPRCPELNVHRRMALTPTMTTTHRGVPVTTPTMTFVDLATRLGRDSLEAAINQADKNDLIDPDSLRDSLAALPPLPGTARLRATLDHRTFTLTDSELERRFLPIASRAGLPRPQTQVRVNGFRVDFHWPELGLVVETDGLRYHRTPAQQARDRIRDQAHAAAGTTPLRFTRAQVRYDPAHVEVTLVAVAQRLQLAAAA